MNKNLKQLISNISKQLISLYEDQAVAENNVWLMVSAITGKSPIQLLTTNYMLTNEEKLKLNSWVIQHSNEYIPLQYLIGEVPFGDCIIAVEPPILIPRPETEEWVYNLSKKLQSINHKNLTILDLCTGSGAIACLLAKALPDATVVATDISLQAITLAQKNAAANDVTLHCIQSDLFSNLKGKSFDIIVSNPPYISAEEWQKLDPMVSKWEDYKALVADDHGLKIIKDIIKKAGCYLRKNDELEQINCAQLYIEIGYQQGIAVALCMQTYFKYVSLLKDYNAKDRVVCGFLQKRSK